MRKLKYDAVVIGSGAAGYNAADRLYEYGVKNVCIVTEGRLTGTSRNTGSDKQTYYKLSLAGDEGDSVMKMTQTLFDGGAVDGDIALAEAANSVPSFMRLVNLGVDFPTNEYGEYVGYKTDHDPYRRATSVGPYTSKRMTEALEASVLEKGLPIIDDCRIIKILVSEGSVYGVLGIENVGENGIGYVAIETPSVIMATGGPASCYYDSVYPECHTGSSGLALDAGADMVNLSEWQYGLASTDFRWNVSGTYQQVLPRYVSVDADGTEREFLTEYFATEQETLKNIFLKGYEWPFDVRKIGGSSYIDLLVYNESVIKGRSVYLDFTREPSGLENGFDSLDETAREYLANSNALVPLPIERLKIMNPGAIALYKEHGIDLSKQPLKIAVCAQHNNGGVKVNADWQTNVKGLYVAGEAAGTFGIFRPGGSALNSTQAGSMRAARHVALFGGREMKNLFDELVDNAVCETEKLIAATAGEKSTVKDVRVRYAKRMSRNFAFLRNVDDMTSALKEIRIDKENFAIDNKRESADEIPYMLKNLETLKMQEVIGESMLYAAQRFGSRGSAFVTDDGDFLGRRAKAENPVGRSVKLVVQNTDDGIKIVEQPVNPVPERDLWFERVWNDYQRTKERNRK